MCLMSLKKKWSQCINDKFEYDREGLMNIYGFSWLLVFYSDIILVGNCLKREQWAFWSLNVSLVEFYGEYKNFSKESYYFD